jgi:hypothetical protein
LPDGAGCFRRDFSGPALLRVPLRPRSLRRRGSHPLWPTFPGGSASILGPMSRPYNPSPAVTGLVWAAPLSLATTQGITLVFSSSGYLDVSVPRVRPLNGYLAFNQVGCPIRKSADQRVCAPPRGLSQLIASFVASESLGIPHAPFLTFFKLASVGILYSLLLSPAWLTPRWHSPLNTSKNFIPVLPTPKA